MENDKAFGYVRVSSDGQLDSTLGVRASINAIVGYADAHGLDLGEKVFAADTEGNRLIDKDGRPIPSRERIVVEAVSAMRNKFLSRRGARSIVERMEPGDHLIIAKVDRAFRNTRDALNTVEMLSDAGYRLHFLDMAGVDFDLSKGFGRLMLTLLAFFAEWEANRISERTKSGLTAAKLAGRAASHSPKVGFLIGADRTLESDPRQIALLRECLTWMEKGWGEERIALHLRSLRHKILNRPEKVNQRWGDEPGLGYARRLMRAAKDMRAILADTGLCPEDGQEYVNELYRRQAERKEKADMVRRKRREIVAAEKLRKRLANDQTTKGTFPHRKSPAEKSGK